MEFVMRVAKWGNSLAVRIPADVARALGLKQGDNVELCALDDGRVAVLTDKQRRAAAIGQLRTMARPLPAGWKMTRDEMNTRGPDAD